MRLALLALILVSSAYALEPKDVIVVANKNDKYTPCRTSE